MRHVTGYKDGRPVWSENAPSSAVGAHLGGSTIQGESERDRELRMQREAMRKARAK